MQRHYSEERIEALLLDKRAEEEKMKSHRENYEHQLELLSEKICRLEEMLRHCTRDYILGQSACPGCVIKNKCLVSKERKARK